MGSGRLKVDEHLDFSALLPGQSVVCRCALEARVMLFCGVGTAVTVQTVLQMICCSVAKMCRKGLSLAGLVFCQCNPGSSALLSQDVSLSARGTLSSGVSCSDCGYCRCIGTN